MWTVKNKRKKEKTKGRKEGRKESSNHNCKCPMYVHHYIF
jgi:hypothetical protein